MLTVSIDKRERGEWKTGLKLNIKKTQIMVSGPITSLQLDGETMEIVTNLGSKSLQMNYGIGEDSWESLGLQGDPTSPF